MDALILKMSSGQWFNCLLIKTTRENKCRIIKAYNKQISPERFWVLKNPFIKNTLKSVNAKNKVIYESML